MAVLEKPSRARKKKDINTSTKSLGLDENKLVSRTIAEHVAQLEFAKEAAEQKAHELEKKLRLAEQREQRLEWQLEDLKTENKTLRAVRWGTEELLREEVRKKQLIVVELTEKLECAEKQLEWFRRQKFNKTSEKDGPKPDDPNQQAKEPGTGNVQNISEPPIPQKRNRGQQPGSEGHGRSDRSELDAVIKFLEIEGGCSCGTCGKAYRLMPRFEESPLTEFEAAVIRKVFLRCIYVSQCDCEGKRIKVADPPPKLYPGTDIGNSIWVLLVAQKFLHGTPTNRILKDLSLYGLHLAAGTVTGGCKVINDLLTPLMEELINYCRGADLWNADETTWRIFGEGKLRWWLWLIASDKAVVYLLDPSRSKRVPSEFFAGSVGVLMTDRLASYKALQESILKAWCLVHLRRDFFNVFKSIASLKMWAKSWLMEIATLFVLNHKRFKLFREDITSGPDWDKAVKELEDHVRKLKLKWEEELKLPNLHKEQAKILRSMKRHWAGYTLFLTDPRIPLHNNRAERLLRNAVVLRKNSYGSGASWAGHLAAKVFSIFQTWLINGLDPKALLLDYFNECSKTPGRPPQDVSQFLPWSMSEERKKKFALPEAYERPG